MGNHDTNAESYKNTSLSSTITMGKLFLIVLLMMPSYSHAEPAYSTLHKAAPSLKPTVLKLALRALACAKRKDGMSTRYFSVIDYTLESTKPRYWLFDLKTETLVYEELVAHGRNTGENWATHFSNKHGTKQSSIGLFKTAQSYMGRNGYSMRMYGLEKGFNDNAFDRNIVMHGGPYVSKAFLEKHGRLGRSWGCPVFRDAVAKSIIDTIKDGELVFIYYPIKSWLEESSYLHCTDE